MIDIVFPDSAVPTDKIQRDDATTNLLFDTFATHRGTMFAVARSVVGDDLAADVVQEVVTRVWHHLDRYDAARGSMRAYLLMMTRGISIDVFSQTRARHTREDREHIRELSWAAADELRNVIRDEEALRVSSAIECLDHHERNLIVSAFYGGETYREIACRLGLPEGTVKSRIRSALHKLRHTLADLRHEVPAPLHCSR